MMVPGFLRSQANVLLSTCQVSQFAALSNRPLAGECMAPDDEDNVVALGESDGRVLGKEKRGNADTEAASEKPFWEERLVDLLAELPSLSIDTVAASVPSLAPLQEEVVEEVGFSSVEEAECALCDALRAQCIETNEWAMAHLRECGLLFEADAILRLFTLSDGFVWEQFLTDVFFTSRSGLGLSSALHEFLRAEDEQDKRLKQFTEKVLVSISGPAASLLPQSGYSQLQLSYHAEAPLDVLFSEEVLGGLTEVSQVLLMFRRARITMQESWISCQQRRSVGIRHWDASSTSQRKLIIFAGQVGALVRDLEHHICTHIHKPSRKDDLLKELRLAKLLQEADSAIVDYVSYIRHCCFLQPEARPTILSLPPFSRPCIPHAVLAMAVTLLLLSFSGNNQHLTSSRQGPFCHPWPA